MSYIDSKKAEKRQRILDASAKVFADKGFYNAKISQIAKVAKVADGTIYLYFASKDDILIQIFEDGMSQVITYQHEKIAEKKTAAEKLYNFAENYAHFIELFPSLAILIQLEIRHSNKFMKDYDNRRFAEYLDIIGNVVVNGFESGEFKKINRHVIKQAIYGALDELSSQWLFLHEDKRFNLKEAFRSYMEIIVAGLLIK